MSWLALREPADAAARSSELVELIDTPRVIHDLGCGSGSMGRWLSPQLPGALHWRLYDRDPALLRYAAEHLPSQSRDGSPVTVDTREADIAHLTAADFAGDFADDGSALGAGGAGGGSGAGSAAAGSAAAGSAAAGSAAAGSAAAGFRAASLVTASALLDLLTSDEVTALAGACVAARAPALLTLSVAGQVSFSPADPLDEPIGAAFNAHQRRTVAGRQLLGPDATEATVEAFARFGAETVVRPSPWRLSLPAHSALLAAWLEGWVTAAVEQDPSLPVEDVEDYVRRRLATADLSVVVEHKDLFAVL